MIVSLQIILEDLGADNPLVRRLDVVSICDTSLLLPSLVKRAVCILKLQIPRFARNDKDKGNRREANVGPHRLYDAYVLALDTGISFNSFPNVARGNNMALNSAPTRITSEIMYIQTSKAIAAPSEP